MTKKIIILKISALLLILTSINLSPLFAFSSRLEIMETTLNNLEHPYQLAEVAGVSAEAVDDTSAYTQRAPAPRDYPLDIGEKGYSIFTLGSQQIYLGLGLGLQSGYIKGNTTYHINFDGGESELEFPLDNALWGVALSAAYKGKEGQEIEPNKDRAILSVEWVKNIERDSDKMKDSDWAEGDGHSGLDVYSESDADLRATMVDLNFIYNFWPDQNISIGPMIGYSYQKFEYDISDTDQVGYGPYNPGSTVFAPGRTLDYEVEYKIPYLGVNSGLLLGEKFKLNFKLGFSPWADAEDRDDHIARYKLSTGDCDGYAWFTGLNASWKFLPVWLLEIEGKYMDIKTEGIQHQEFYAGADKGTTFDVDDEITSSSFLASAKLKYTF